MIGLLTLLIIKGTERQNDPVPGIAKEREEKLADTRSGMAEEMTSYRLISKDKGTVQLPVNLAMELTLQDLQQSTPRPSQVPVNPALPAPAAVEPVDAGTASTAGSDAADDESAAEEAAE